MRRKAWMVGLGSASIALSSLCGCSWDEIFPAHTSTLPNAVALDRALRLCSLTEGEQPYHLILEISPPAHPATSIRGLNSSGQENRAQDFFAHIEVFWLNPITYRTDIRSRGFSQIRIVNGGVVEERDLGDFYPRWIQNFIDAILDPVPQADKLRKIPGAVPVGVQSHACISNQAALRPASDQTSIMQVCFQDAEPRLASGVDFTRSVWFDNFAPFGQQQIARTLVNNLPANLRVQGQVTLLEPLRKQDYALTKAREFTLPAKRIQTALVSKITAQSMLDTSAARGGPRVYSSAAEKRSGSPTTLYIRTDRTGKVREAYLNNSDPTSPQDTVMARALALKFKPLLVNGVPRQMEAPLTVPLTAEPVEAGTGPQPRR